MLKYYTPKHFDPREFVPPEVWHELDEASLLVMDYRILKTADAIREYFAKPVTINDWFVCGHRTLCGYRTHAAKTGARWSQHKFGRAIDCVIKDVPPEEARRAILREPGHFPYITVMEADVPWLHIDCRAIFDMGIQMISA